MKKLFLLTLLTLSCLGVYCQKVIQGIIVDEHVDPIPFVTVTVKGTTHGAITDFAGRFVLNIDSIALLKLDTADLKLEVGFVGYSNAEFQAEKTNVIQLVSTAVLLEDIVISGGQEKQKKEKFAIARVFYGTDRGAVVNNGQTTFLPDRGKISYGACDISIPVDRKRGSIPEPSLLRFEIKRDPEKHFVLKQIEPMDKTKFFQDVNGRLNKGKNKNALIFIHGYNVSFQDAAFRTAQMAKDLNFEGVPLFYSWPSRSAFHLYPSDEVNIELSEPLIKKFIKDVLKSTQTQNLYLVGHSMGTRGLTKALNALLTEEPALRNKIKEVILAAPDIDAEVFRQNIAPIMIGVQHNLTLYSSSNDLALKASKLFHGYARAGQSGTSLLVMNGIETIDASDIGTDFLGHSYFANTDIILKDIGYLFAKGIRASNRLWLQKHLSQNIPYWTFKL